MTRLFQQLFARQANRPDPVTLDLQIAASRNAKTRESLDETIASLLQHNEREPQRPH